VEVVEVTSANVDVTLISRPIELVDCTACSEVLTVEMGPPETGVSELLAFVDSGWPLLLITVVGCSLDGWLEASGEDAIDAADVVMYDSPKVVRCSVAVDEIACSVDGLIELGSSGGAAEEVAEPADEALTALADVIASDVDFSLTLGEVFGSEDDR
jgi:hypothetical protein